MTQLLPSKRLDLHGKLPSFPETCSERVQTNYNRKLPSEDVSELSDSALGSGELSDKVLSTIWMLYLMLLFNTICPSLRNSGIAAMLDASAIANAQYVTLSDLL